MCVRDRVRDRVSTVFSSPSIGDCFSNTKKVLVFILQSFLKFILVLVLPGRSTCDRILTLNLIAQRRREFGRPTYAAYVCLLYTSDAADE